MRKIIKRKIQISTHKRDLIDFINDEFYSHDKHNAFLEFTMKSLPTDNIIALFYFQKTKRYVETKAFVDGDKFTIEFDTSLINTDETVLGFIYFEKVAQSADVHRFSFGVKVSEIDKLHDIPIQEQTTKRVVAIENIVTKAELDELFKRIEKNGGTYDDTEIRNSISSISERVQTLENKPDNDTRYDDSDVKSRLTLLETNASRYLTEHQPLTSIEERIQQVEARFNNLSNIYLSSHQSLEHLASKDALSKVEQRVEQLEQNRGSDNHDFITRQELEGKNYVATDELRNYTQSYHFSSLKNRVTSLEMAFLSDSKNYLTTTVAEETYAKKSEIPNTTNFATTDSVNKLLRAQGEQATKLSTLEAKSAYEIHGTGMPNGQVSAPIGTTYVDMSVTNGALKWIKESGSGNTGWKVFTGDTGWRTLPLKNKRGNAKLQVRRINDQIIVKFDGLDWGWFGVDDLQKQESSGYIVEKTIDGKQYTWIKLDVGKGNDVLPVGFRSASSLLTGLYGDLGDLLGSVYVGGPDDSNAIQLRYAMAKEQITSNILSQIRISPITFITDDDYPTTLP